MAKAKSEERKLAERIAKQRGIKVKSAYRHIQRSIKGEAKPERGLGKAAAAKLREFVGKRKAEREPRPQPVQPRVKRPVPVRKRRFEPDRIYTVPVRAHFALYGSGFGQKKGSFDNRSRQINLELRGWELEEFLAAETEEEALEMLTELDLPAMRFLNGGEVSDLREFSIVETGQRFGAGYFRE